MVSFLRFLSIVSMVMLTAVTAWAAAPTISSTSPATNALNVSATANLTVTFNQSMDNTTLIADNIKVHGNYRGFYTAVFSVSGNTVTINPDSSFKPGEVITVTVTTGVENANNEPMTSPRVYSFTADAPAGYSKFSSPTSYTAYGSGSGDHYVTLADLDKDGDIDIASTTAIFNKMSVMLNNGNGTYASAVTYTTLNSFDISAADVDADGDMDLVVANNNAYGMSVFINNGSGAFGTRNDYAFTFPQSNAQFLVTVDIDGDGDIDVVTNDLTNNYLHIMKNNGSGAFTSTDKEFTTRFGALSAGDLDKDGDMDILAACATVDSVEQMNNDGAGNLSMATRFYWTSTDGPTATLIADINSISGDKQDLVWLNGGTDLLTYFKDGSGIPLFSADNVSVGDYPVQVNAVDVDTDSDLDLVVANYNAATFSVLSNTGSGTGTFTQTTYATPDNPDDLATADLDGDGDMDVVTINNDATVSVFDNYNGGHVASITPANGTLDASASSNIVVVFDENIDSGTLTSSTVKLIGSVSGVHAWTLSSYVAGTYTATLNPTVDFAPGELVTVVVTNGVESSLGINLEKGYSSQFVVAAGNGGVFGAATDYSVGTQPKSVILADLNADGDPDLVTVNSGSDNVSVRLNNGDGTFGTEALLSTGDNPNSVAAGDVDGDGDVDLLVTVTGADQLARFLNNGSGTFGSASTYATSTGPIAIALRDLDGDGDLDVVYSNGQALRQKNDGAGGFSDEWGFSQTDVGVAIADVDNDGDMDVIGANENTTLSNIYVGYNSGSGVWNTLYSGSNTYSTGHYPTGIIAGDFNGDSYVDIITTNLALGNGSISYFQNNLNGTYAAKVDYTVATGAQPRGLTAVDNDGDGDLDVVVANGAGDAAKLFINNGSGVFSDGGQYSTNDNPYGIASADIDGDSDMDIVTANYSGNNVSVKMGTIATEISSFSPTANALNVSVSSNVVVTFNQPMKASTLNSSTIIVSGSQHGVYAGSYGHSSGVMTFNPTDNFFAGEFITVLITTGVQNVDGAALSTPSRYTFVSASSAEGAYGAKQSYSTIDYPSDIAAGDMDGDGDIDVVSANGSSKTISVLLNNGLGALGAADTIYEGASSQARFIKIADLNSDGDLDVVVANQSSNSFSVLFNNGDATFGDAVVYPFADTYPTIALGDVDNDGDVDLVITKYNSNQAIVYLNNGSGTFSAQTPLTAGTGTWGVDLGDVDGDKDLDIITADYDGNTISVLKNNGDGTFGTKTSVSAGILYPDGIAIGDLDGDGDIDLGITAWDDAKSSILINNGSGTFSVVATYSNDSPSKVKFADMDGDGDLDFITTEGSVGVYVRTNNGSGSFSAPATYKAGSYVQSVELADMDGDGDIDIVAGDQSGQNIVIIKSIELVKVNSTAPAANALNVAKTSNITVTFNVDMNSATLVDSTVVVHGSNSGLVSGAISYDSPSKTMTFNPTNDFVPGEIVSFVITTDPKNGNGINLQRSYSGSFTVYVAGAGNFVYHDSIPDLGQDALNPSTMGNALNSGDVTEDGKTDLLRIYNGNIKVLKNNTTSFDSVSAVSINYTAYQSLADLDNDGDLDMTQVNYSDNALTVLINGGSGSFTPQTPMSTSASNPRNTILKDMDNDGFIDVTLNGSGSQQVYTYYNDGLGNFVNSNYSYKTIHYDIYDYRCADVNNDGLNDIITLHSGNGNNFVSITMNSGERSFASPVDYTVAEGGRKMTTADVNGDGYVDFIIANQDGLFFSVVLNNANGTFASAVNYSLGITLNQVEAADMDGDGDQDVVIRGYDDNTNKDKLVVAYNNGSGVFGNQLEFNIKATAPDYYYSHSNLTLLDYDSDSDLDIAVQAQHYYGSNQYVNTLLFENVSVSSSTPTTAASNVTTSGISGTTATINWTNGNGSRRLVVMRQGSAVNATPTTNFSPNAAFSSGSSVGIGNYAVYGGSGSSVTVSGLSKSTTYHVSVFEMNGLPGSENVLTTSAPTASLTTSQFDGPFDQTPGNALNFDGRWSQSNNSISLNDSFTVELWVKPSAIGSNMTIFTHGNNYTWIGINASGNFFARAYDDDLGDPVDFTGSTTTAVVNQWYHVALTAKNGQTAKLYVNGALEATSSSTIGTVYASSTLYPGGDYNNSSYRGLIDEFRIWNSTRTASDIRSNMHKTFEGIPANLKHYWQLNEGSGNSSAEHASSNTMVDSDPLLWATSDAPVGGGSNTSSSVAANTTGTQTVGNVKLNMTDGFNDPTDVYVSDVLVAPNSYPSSYNSSVGNKYFIIDAYPYPAPGSFSATLTLSYGAGVLTDNNAANYILYKRGSSSTGTWTSFGSASSVNTSTGEVTWTNISSFSQAIVVNQNDVLPVELTSFTATAEKGSVELLWKTATELNNAGFEIERSAANSTQKRAGEWTKIGAVDGHGTSNTSHEYSFVDASVKGNVRYRLKQIDRDGGFAYSNVLEVTVAAPSVFALQQNYPNPFNPSTMIEFTLAVKGLTTLKIYDIVGREVATLVNNELLEAGVYHQKQFNAGNLASGVYFARLTSGSQSQLKKLVLMK